MGPLDGIRVIDAGLLVQAPQAAALLADMGADVIKVELPLIGDQSRWIPATYGEQASGYWEGCNRGKRSVTIDLRTPLGRDAFLRLTDTADVLVSNFVPGTLDRWGLDFETMSSRNPRLVYATGSTYGPIGALSKLEGADLAGQAAGGLIATTGADGDRVTPIGVTVADHTSSQHLAAGILAALFARHTTGRGQRVDVSLVGGAIWAQASEMSAYLLSGKVPGRANNGHPLINGAYGIVRTADGYLAIVGVIPPARPGFAAAVGRPGLFDDARFASPLLSERQKIELLAELEPAFELKPTQHWVETLRPMGVRVAPVRNYEQIAADETVYENGYLVRVDHPTRGPTTIIGTPIRLSDTPLQPAVYAPELGEHTEEVLLEIGLSWEDIAALREANAV